MAVLHRSLKKTAFRICLMLEAFVFLTNYFFGSHGLYALRHMHVEKKLLDVECAALRREIAQRTQERNLKKNDAFYQQRIAREQLQMAFPDEVIFQRPM